MSGILAFFLVVIIIEVNVEERHPSDSHNTETILFDCKESLFFLVFKYGPLSAESSKKHEHTITHNSHQSLSIFRWVSSFLLMWGGMGPDQQLLHFRSSEQESCCTPHSRFFVVFFSLRTLVAFSDTDICT